MKRSSRRWNRRAFTLIEILVVVVLAALLFLMSLRTLSDRGRTSFRTVCLNNLKQIDIGLLVWAQDHQDLFPWEVLATNGGSMDSVADGEIVPHFQMLSSHGMQPERFVCPSDSTRKAVSNWVALTNRNISYFLALDPNRGHREKSILVGDRNLQADGRPLPAGLFLATPDRDMNWTLDMHPGGGQIAFADGHVEFVKTNRLNAVFAMNGVPTNRIVVP